MRGLRNRLVAWQCRCAVMLAGGCLHAASGPFPLFHESATPFLRAIETAAAAVEPLDQAVTGVTVPHHLLAADMIATTLRLASKQHHDRILLLSPDHFRRGAKPAATTLRSFQTPLGAVVIDTGAAQRLLETPVVADSNLFSHEHGVQAVLPFLARYFPATPVVPVALDIRSGPGVWRKLADALKPIITPRTLIVQSTDFSHYLPQAAAAVRDAETLRLLAIGDAGGIAALDQPAHLDSKAAQWLQMTLQREVFGCGAPVVVDNRNAIRYGGRPEEPRTTSYITQLWSPHTIPAAALPGEAWFFGGDTHFGRHVATAFADPAHAKRIRDAILAVTGSRPLVVNLEGVLLDPDPATARHPLRIGMDAKRAIGEMTKLHVAAVVVANNHTHDFGNDARARMLEMLENRGIRAVDAGPPLDFGPFRLAAATDVVNLPEPRRDVLTDNDLAPWRSGGSPKPLFAFLHCGTEYADAPGGRERQLAGWAERAGAALVTGCHPHRPSPGWELGAESLRFFSLGNLIFDQTDPRNGGVLLEVRFFEQGTWAARVHSLGNLHAAVEPVK